MFQPINHHPVNNDTLYFNTGTSGYGVTINVKFYDAEHVELTTLEENLGVCSRNQSIVLHPKIEQGTHYMSIYMKPWVSSTKK